MAISICGAAVDQSKRELIVHGTRELPVACYGDDLQRSEVPWHWHEEFEAVVIVEGELVLGVGNATEVIHKGDGCFINSGVIHSCWAQENSACRIHSVVFHPDFIGGALESVFYQQYLNPLLQRSVFGYAHLSQEILWQAEAIRAIESVWQAFSSEEYGYEIEARNQLSTLICHLRANCLSGKRVQNGKAQKNEQRIKSMLQFIHEHFPENLTTAQIAQSASISESECLRCFRSTIRETPIHYLRQYRLRQAAYLLITTQEKIATIANRCGFDDLSYFAKAFREMHGLSPSKYRERKP